MKNIIVGTAGHIDHGKTALVKALTGIDADRLEEEKRRGITIDLGFAHLQLSPEVRLGFVDVPGHERFVKNMLAGVAGIDVVLFVIAADESIKPQTREHFDICRLLGIRRGVLALTKADLVDRDMLELVRLETEELVAGSFLEGAPMVPVSSVTGAGLEELRRELARIAAEISERNAAGYFRLPIDRVFSVKGFGTVGNDVRMADGRVLIVAEVTAHPGDAVAGHDVIGVEHALDAGDRGDVTAYDDHTAWRELAGHATHLAHFSDVDDDGRDSDDIVAAADQLIGEDFARGKIQNRAGSRDIFLNHDDAPRAMKHTQGEDALQARDLVVVELHRIDDPTAELVVLGVGAEDGSEQNPRGRAFGMRFHSISDQYLLFWGLRTATGSGLQNYYTGRKRPSRRTRYLRPRHRMVLPKKAANHSTKLMRSCNGTSHQH